MTSKRPMGSLEDEVMSYLWATGAPAKPGEVHQAIAPELAYTTIMTVLTRLWQKDLLGRVLDGRAYVYTPTKSQAESLADRMRVTLHDASDRAAVLSSFVDGLDQRDATLIKKFLEPDDS